MKQHNNRHIAVILTVMMAAFFIPVTSFASDEADTIEFTVGSGEELVFDEGDFNDVCEDLTGETLDYVYFDPPSSSKGILYYDYDGSDQDEVDDSDEYYYDEDDGDAIGDVSFVADDDYDGTVTISYIGCDTDGNDFSGEIVIDISGDEDAGSADTIYLSGTAGSGIPLIASYFNTKCEDLTDDSLSYVKFTLPSSLIGTLYYGYTSAGSYTSEADASTKYYYSQAYYLKNVSFVPAGNDAGTATITYTGYAAGGTSYTGEVYITFTASSSSSSSAASTLTPLAANAAAVPTSSKVVVNGSIIPFDAYNINGSNYFKLRDLAYAVNGSAKQFGVAYDSSQNSILLISNSSYTAVGGELASGNGLTTSAELTTSPIYKDGAQVSLGAYNINGNNYFKLRDLAKAFDIGVSWNAANNTVEIITANSYTE